LRSSQLTSDGEIEKAFVRAGLKRSLSPLQQRQQLSDIRHDAQMREERAANRPLLLNCFHRSFEIKGAAASAALFV
jgi:hypothetical protein